MSWTLLSQYNYDFIAIGRHAGCFEVTVSFPSASVESWHEHALPVMEILNCDRHYVITQTTSEPYKSAKGSSISVFGIDLHWPNSRRTNIGSTSEVIYLPESSGTLGSSSPLTIGKSEIQAGVRESFLRVIYADSRRHLPCCATFLIRREADLLVQILERCFQVVGVPELVEYSFATPDDCHIRPPQLEGGWNFYASGNYKPGFDPLQRPKGICSALKHRYPLLTVKKELETFFQLDIVHGAKESFLDCQYRAEDEPEVMEIIQSVVKEFPDDEIRIEKWNGDFYRRWITDPADGVWPDEYPSGELEVDTADAQRDSTSSPGAMPRFVASQDASARIDAPTNQYAMERADSFSELMITRFGVQYDLSFESLKAVDQVVATFHADGPVIDSTIMNYAYYIGEVMRRSLGGHWTIFPESPKRPPVLRIGVHDIAIFDLTISLFDERQPIYPMCLKLQSMLSSQGA